MGGTCKRFGSLTACYEGWGVTSVVVGQGIWANGSITVGEGIDGKVDRTVISQNLIAHSVAQVIHIKCP